MWRIMYRLVKTFVNEPDPRAVAETMKQKIEAFKSYIPLLLAICNPGMKPRHWKSVCIYVCLSPLLLLLL